MFVNFVEIVFKGAFHVRKKYKLIFCIRSRLSLPHNFIQYITFLWITIFKTQPLFLKMYTYKKIYYFLNVRIFYKMHKTLLQVD